MSNLPGAKRSGVRDYNYWLDYLPFKVIEKSSERVSLPHKDRLRSHRRIALADTISSLRTEAYTLARTIELHAVGE